MYDVYSAGGLKISTRDDWPRACLRLDLVLTSRDVDTGTEEILLQLAFLSSYHTATDGLESGVAILKHSLCRGNTMPTVMFSTYIRKHSPAQVEYTTKM